MNQGARPHSSADPEPVVIGPATESDLPAIVGVLNDAIVNSNATLTTQPTSVAERRDWLRRFSPTGPHRLLVARRGNQVLGYAASQPYRDHEGFRETVEVSIALDASSRGQGVGTALYHALLECLAGEPRRCGRHSPAQRRVDCAAPQARLYRGRHVPRVRDQER